MSVRVNGLGCRRGDSWLFRNLQASIEQGSVVWLRGDNGRGKTTLLRLLAQLSAPDEGTITRVDLQQPAVYLAHANALNGDLSAQEALHFMTLLHGQACDNQRIGQALRALGVERCRRQLVRTLSQGQRRRVALARLALETQPALWLLDEPYDALDVTGVAIVNGLIEGHAARGGCVVLTSHIPVTLAHMPLREWALDVVPAG